MKQPCKLVLGGGAARGLAHIGAIDVLQEEYDVRAIVGTSMGAIIGGLLACGYKPHELHRMLDDLGSRNLLSLVDFSWRSSGLMTGVNILEWFDDVTGKVNIEDLRMPFAAIAYDLRTRRTVIIDRGRLSWAMRASSSLPFLFSPLMWGDYELVDGGAEHPLPLEFDNLFDKRLSTVAVNVLPIVPNEPVTLDLHDGETPQPSRRNLLNVALTWTTDNQHYLATKAMMQAEAELMINAFDDELDEADFLAYDRIIEVGRNAARKALRERTPFDLLRGAARSYLRQLRELKRR